MSKHGEGHKSAHDKLQDLKTLEEILDTAMSFEKTAEAFYTGLIDKVGKPLRELVSELAEEETRHYQLFKELRDHPDTEGQLASMINIPAEDRSFADYIKLPKLGKDPDDQSVLQYALQREDAAAKQYGDLAKNTPEGAIRDLFVALAKEELEHKAELEKRYYELIHTGGV